MSSEKPAKRSMGACRHGAGFLTSASMKIDIALSADMTALIAGLSSSA